MELHSVDADSVTAGIYEMFQRRVSANVRNLVVPKERRRSSASCP